MNGTNDGTTDQELDPKTTVHFEVVPEPTENGRSMFDVQFDPYPEIADLKDIRIPEGRGTEVARRLQQNGVTIDNVGAYSISASCPASKFETLFQTTLVAVAPPEKAKAPKGYVLIQTAPGQDIKLPSTDGLNMLIDKVCLQNPPIPYQEWPFPPFWNDAFRLLVPNGVSFLMNASPVHNQGYLGTGVRVAMVDSGFHYHPYFQAMGYNFQAVPAAFGANPYQDPSGHGTGEAANLFAVAPGIDFVGVKQSGNQTLDVYAAIAQGPQIMTNSWGTFEQDGDTPLPPAHLYPLYVAILHAVASGITVCFSAGNGHRGFPAAMPEVIACGGVFVDQNQAYQASNYASSFQSMWFPGRHVPDVCGLCGQQPTADYIVLPVPNGSQLERAHGWGAFSGTSAAAPMVAGICALLKQRNPALTPQAIKGILMNTARDITAGVSAMGDAAHPGWDAATGAGLGDAAQAWAMVNALMAPPPYYPPHYGYGPMAPPMPLVPPVVG